MQDGEAYTIAEIDSMLTFYPLTTEVDADLADKIDSVVTGEPTGSDRVLNVVSLTQAEYDAGTPVATTFYIITDKYGFITRQFTGELRYTSEQLRSA